MIRWVSPVRHFMRTATVDTPLRDKIIKAGESVVHDPSANRDEGSLRRLRVFAWSIRSTTFGYGARVCLRQHLARMEMEALYRALLERVEHIELDGTPQYAQAAFVGGLKSLPIRYRLK